MLGKWAAAGCMKDLNWWCSLWLCTLRNWCTSLVVDVVKSCGFVWIVTNMFDGRLPWYYVGSSINAEWILCKNLFYKKAISFLDHSKRRFVSLGLWLNTVVLYLCLRVWILISLNLIVIQTVIQLFLQIFLKFESFCNKY